MTLHASVFFLCVRGGEKTFTTEDTENSLHQKPQNVRTAVREITDDNQRAGQNNRRITAHKTKLQVTNRPAQIHDRAPEAVNQAIDDANVEQLPQTFTRYNQNGLDHRGIVDLIDVVLVLKQARHPTERLLLERHPTNTDAGDSNHDRDQHKKALLRNFHGTVNRFSFASISRRERGLAIDLLRRRREPMQLCCPLSRIGLFTGNAVYGRLERSLEVVLRMTSG